MSLGCVRGVASANDGHDLYTIACDDEILMLKEAFRYVKLPTRKKVSSVGTDASGNLYAVGKSDKKLYKWKKPNWEYMGLDNVRKVAGGLREDVYAVKTDDTLHKYNQGFN